MNTRESVMPASRRSMLRTSLHRFIPAHFHDPVGLAMRLIRTRHPAARFAMLTSALGLAAIPLDVALASIERRYYRRAPEPRLPLIFVVGAPRTGTTVVAQTLAHHLPVHYLNNLTAIFPRAPITANRLLGPLLGTPRPDYISYYGRSLRFSGFSDGLHIWDRWFGNDRKQTPTALGEEPRRDMVRFFGALERASGKPLVNKHNSLNTCAHLVAGALPTSYFIAMTRDPVFLAQSLLQARLEICGDIGEWYGVEAPEGRSRRARDPVVDVCEQVRFHERKLHEQQAIIGPQRFRIVSYEEFCAHPAELVRHVSERILDRPVSDEMLRGVPRSFNASNRIRVPTELFERVQRALTR